MANTFIVFDAFKKAMFLGQAHLSDTYRVYIMSAGWTPSIATSTVASMTAQLCQKLSSSWSDGRQLAALPDVTISAAGVIRVDISDIAFTASTGTNLSAQYAFIAKSGAGAHKTADPPMGYWALSSAEVVASQINCTIDASGIFETSDNV